MTFYTSFNDNHQALINIIKANSTILEDVATRNIIDYDYRLLSTKRFPAIAIPLPEYFPSDEGSPLGMVNYELAYRIIVATDYLGTTNSRNQLTTLAYKVIELLETRSNLSLDSTCTYTRMVAFNPNHAIGGSEKALQRVGEIRFITAHSIMKPP